MKPFCLVFIFQVLVLLTQPCHEIFPEFDESGGGQSVSRSDERSSPSPEQDECSVFCLCSCCSHPFADQVYVVAISRIVDRTDVEDIFADNPDLATSAYSDSVWQPPKA